VYGGPANPLECSRESNPPLHRHAPPNHPAPAPPKTVYCAATVSPSQDIAFMLSIAWTSLNLLACGYFQRFQAYRLRGLTFLRYLSAMNWAWEGLVAVELQGRVFGCGGGGDPGLGALGVYTGGSWVGVGFQCVGWFGVGLGGIRPLFVAQEASSLLKTHTSPITHSLPPPTHRNKHRPPTHPPHMTPELIPATGALGPIAATINRGLGPGCIAAGDVILDYYDIRHPYTVVVVILVAYLVGMTGLTYVALYRGARRQGGGK